MDTNNLDGPSTPTRDPFSLMPMLWPVAFDADDHDTAVSVHLTVDAPPLVSRPGGQYQLLCGWDAAHAHTATYLLDDNVLPRVELHGGLLCSGCASEREALVDTAIADAGVDVPDSFVETGQ